MASSRLVPFLLCVGLLGCPGDDGAESTSGAETSSGSMSTAGSMSATTSMSTSSATSASSTETTQGDPGSSGEASGTTEVATGPVTGGTDPMSTSTDPSDGGASCDPDSHEHPCLQCFVDDCCKSWTMCLADEGCTCLVDCHVIEGGSLGGCESQCDTDGELYQALFFCGQMYCLGTCEWDCC